MLLIAAAVLVSATEVVEGSDATFAAAVLVAAGVVGAAVAGGAQVLIASVAVVAGLALLPVKSLGSVNPLVPRSVPAAALAAAEGWALVLLDAAIDGGANADAAA